MLALKRHPLACASDGDGFHDAFYLATHIGYAISAYSAVQAPIQRLVPWLDVASRLLHRLGAAAAPALSGLVDFVKRS